MIELPRALAGPFRSLLRKSFLGSQARAPCPPVLCRAGRQGLTLSCQLDGVALRHHSPGTQPADVIVVPASLLAEVEGKTGTVTLERVAPMKGKASWSEHDVPRDLEFETALPESVPEPPQPTGRRCRLEPAFLAALAEGFRSTPREGGRAALQQVLLRGGEGSVAATDGRQLLIQGGFELPWKDDVLIPAIPAFASKELSRGEPVLSRSDGHVSLEVGPWLFRLQEGEVRHYPDIRAVIPRAGDPATRLVLDGEDAEALSRALPRMAGSEERFSPVALELGAEVRLLAGKGGEGLVLPRSRAEGPAVRVLIDRRLLLRAVQLGFHEVAVRPGKPLHCQDGLRTFLWMPLDDKDAQPEADAEPNSEPAAVEPAPASCGCPPSCPPGAASAPAVKPTPARAKSVPRPSANGKHGAEEAPPAPQPADPLAEAEALAQRLQEALAQTGRLIAALRQQREQSRAVLDAVASLRRLGQLDG